MTIHIPIVDLDPQVRTLYLEGKIFDISVDFAQNSLMSFYEDTEILVFSFDDHVILDNRLRPCSVIKNKTEIVLSF
jgi:hypothetical protein